MGACSINVELPHVPVLQTFVGNATAKQTSALCAGSPNGRSGPISYARIRTYVTVFCNKTYPLEPEICLRPKRLLLGPFSSK